jgi:hypothetical protein
MKRTETWGSSNAAIRLGRKCRSIQPPGASCASRIVYVGTANLGRLTETRQHHQLVKLSHPSASNHARSTSPNEPVALGCEHSSSQD